ncbi:hypothetical protein GIB67_025849 [Kingdonia uniflora]|uniref:Carbonic anhydrase n=1 Tax=Kingdonia uniflora TaxID=39325 RepID=A0A7J7MD73_9MAGN|nr:hypothetical protein GIB67_025849 [Kingdonia uniflora]
MAAFKLSLVVSNDNFSSLNSSFGSVGTNKGICGSLVKLKRIENTNWRFPTSVKKNPYLRLEASRDSLTLTQKPEVQKMEKKEGSDDLFDEIKDRFLSFKKSKYLENSKHFQNLAQAQAPKFMVIACVDSRVCPSNILGFQPGEAFIVRNVANLVPPLEKGPSETNAALEFAVTSLEVENIFVMGHSCCGGIRALMSMEDEGDSSSFIRNWVVISKNVKISTKASAGNLDFDQQCRHCEKESVNRSLVNLLSYPWLEERVSKGVLSIHGGYYDFINCTFEKWTLDYKGSTTGKECTKYAIKDRAIWS